MRRDGGQASKRAMFDAPQDYAVDDDADEGYRARRRQIAEAAQGWTADAPLPEIDYTPEETSVWSLVCRLLYGKHAHHACAAYLEGWEALGLPTGRIPGLAELNARLGPLTDFRLIPSAGWIPESAYYGTLAERAFPTTQHLRRPDGPLNGHDPDLLHSLLGHAVLLAHPTFARLHQLTGAAGLRLQTERAREVLARVFWFTCEVGVLVERGQLVCCGARLLSSPDAMDAFRTADVRPLDLGAMARGDGGGSVLYRAESMAELEDTVGTFLETLDDETPDRLTS
jgi:phenylalanine-4-hydroxylase